MYDGDNHFSHDGKQGRCGNGEGYSWDDNDYRPDGCLELPSTLSIACRSVAKEGAEKPALIYTYICLLFFNSSSYGYHTSAL